MSNRLKSQKLFFLTQIALRLFAAVLVIVAASLIFTGKQTVEVYGLVVDARYSYSPAYKFCAWANMVAGVFSFLSLIAFILASKSANPAYYFYMFLHDMIIMLLLVAACAASTAVGYIGKYGNSHTGWIAICDHFAQFCNRITAAVALSYVGIVFYVILTVTSANKSRQIHV